MNFADPPITVVAILCLILPTGVTSLMLFFVPVRVVLFIIGMLMMLPFLVTACKGRSSKSAQEAAADAKDADEGTRQPLLGGPQGPRLCFWLANIFGRIPD